MSWKFESLQIVKAGHQKTTEEEDKLSETLKLFEQAAFTCILGNVLGNEASVFSTGQNQPVFKKQQ